ncbi:amino acid/amide ABC transporter membrane protein 2 (HAAT family) [Antricoccus suffuscus]|uniref:Amino acid/amide ABC transporter membrane protein 2 (HAAT family) n=1 Tax=Antricoccus suffuscus TaxID=1629062 RepID=A0A2T1A134_9ACTN|nr:branched-chain amino acid ABC transporter permease [Antricoccus suffuscus]PRZ42312.1 amino acid/amide ABC transporter membrane protein 2 (HAAT family) [Antricoccus suffuscus]
MTRLRKVLTSTGWLGLIVAVLVASLPYWFIQTQFLLSVCTVALIFMTASIGWNIISGFGGQISFGHSIFFGLGAYTAALFQNRLNGNAWVGVLLGMVVAAVVAVLLGLLTLRLRGIFFALATFALTLTFAILATHFQSFTGGAVGVTLPILGNDPAQFSFDNKLGYYYIALIFAAASFIVAWLILRSRFGLQLRAIRADQDAAKACGVLATRVKLIALALSAVVTGLAGGIYLEYIRFIDPNSAFGANLATQIAVIAFVGGSGYLWGPVIGAAILVPLQQILNSGLSTFPAGFNLVVYAVVVLAILWFEPRGLLALRRRFSSRKRRAKGDSPDAESSATDDTSPGSDNGLTTSGVDR